MKQWGLGSLLMAMLAVQTAAQEAAAPKVDPAVGQVQELLRTGDSYRVAEQLERDGEPRSIGKRYFAVMNGLYWSKRDLPAVLVVARSGIQYCLSRAGGAPPAEAAELRGLAKSMAYDLASFTWPGWNEKGISPTLADAAVGLDAARLNLRLAVELKRGPDPMFNAHWVLGAQHLAAGQFAEAVRSFDQGAEVARMAGKRDQELMARGYTLLTKLLSTPDPETEKALAANAQALMKEKDGQFYQEQIDTARKVFSAAFKR